MAKMVGVTLTKEERAALLEMSKQDTRYPWDEMRFLIREEARRRGLWTEDEKAEAE